MATGTYRAVAARPDAAPSAREGTSMDSFSGKIAVITGGGSGMGRELARRLSAEGCHLALCDVGEDALAETKRQCAAAAPAGTRISLHRCDVTVEAEVLAFRDAALAAHGTDHVHLVFNNAGIGGGGSFLQDRREDWDRVFAVCWSGVYFVTRAFLPLLVAAPEGHLVNTSSINGFWASLGPERAHTAYCAAKFAVKGFTEALITDLRLHAPHVKVSVVMPGHIGTDIAANSALVLGQGAHPKLDAASGRFRESAPTTAADAAAIILDGVRAGRWRILVGEDAQLLDQFVRETPEDAYEAGFADRLRDHDVLSYVL